MYVLKYKSLNSQSKVGRGFVDGNNSAQKATGGTETKGMDWGETTGKDHMKLFGLEDFWGNVWEWIDGYFSDSSRNIKTATEKFNDTGSNYTARGVAASSNVSWGYMNNCVGDTHSGFTPTSTSGSETTYFCDYAGLDASYLPLFGGTWSYASNAGAFVLRVAYSASDTRAYIGARLMYV
jgi:formylglycine-generating enzyme required for sulfatase activity